MTQDVGRSINLQTPLCPKSLSSASNGLMAAVFAFMVRLNSEFMRARHVPDLLFREREFIDQIQ
jgi:hypothetical protein